MNHYLKTIQQKLGSLYIPILITILSILIFILAFSNVQAKQYSFRINQVAEETIQSPVTIEDVEQTEINRERARNNVADVYVFQPSIAQQQIEISDRFFEWVLELRDQEFTLEQIIQLNDANNNLEDLEERQATLTQDRNKQILFGELTDREKVLIYQTYVEEAEDDIQDLALDLPIETITNILSVSEENLAHVRTVITDLLTTNLDDEIELAELNRVIDQVHNQIEEMNLSEEMAESISDFMFELMVPTVVFSASETLKRQEEASNAVQPSYILQGQIVVQEGHIVSENAYRQLDLLGLVNRKSGTETIYVFIGLIFIHGLLLLLLFKKYSQEDLGQAKMKMTSYSLLFVLGFLFVKIFEIIQTNGTSYAMLLFPVYLLPLLLIPHTDRKIGLFFIFFFNLFSLFIIHDSSSITVTYIISIFYIMTSLASFANFVFEIDIKRIRQILKFALLAYTIVSIPIVVIINITAFSQPSLIIFAFAFLNLILALLAYFLFEPYWSQLFNSKAPLTLSQLSDLNHPLLKKLIEVAPGSYQHSMLVANLASNATDRIGGDALLARVASYYHDVGKTLHPLFYVENLSQGMESPHSMIEAVESAQIIIGHVSEGAKILEEYHFSQSVIDICKQHHGTTLVRYFYHQAKQKSKERVASQDFQYPGPIPQTKEAMIVMLADSIEAASRSMKEYSQEAIEKLVDSIINSKIEEGQFEDSLLTVSELKEVRKSFIRSIASMYHTRIEYPD